MEPAGPEGNTLSALGRWLFEPPPPTALILAVLAIGALLVVLLRRFALATNAPGRMLLGAARRAEMGILAFLLLAMVLLSAFQIFARNVLGAGLVWIDPLLRYLTLWIGFLGAARAAAEGRHIHMDVLSRTLAPPWRRAAGRATHLAAASICAVLAESAYRHLASEHAFDSREFLALPSWILLAVIPLAFALMAYRFLDRALLPPPLAPEPAAERAES